VIKRILSGLVMICLAILFFNYADKNISKIIFLILSILSVIEFGRILKIGKAENIVMIFSALFVFLYEDFSLEKKVLIVILFDLILFFSWRIFKDKIDSKFIEYTAITMFFGIIPFYIMYIIFNTNKLSLLYVMLLVWIYDMAAYFTGITLGKNKLVPNISPKKSWEGLIGATIAVFAFSFIYYYNDLFIARDIILLAFLVVFLAPIGDLTVSLLKRNNLIKDSGNIIPGHGGVLDRMDSFIFLVPIIFYIGVL